MEYEATLDTLTATVATFSVPTVTKLKDANVHSSLVVTATGPSGTFRAGEWKAGRKYKIVIERAGV